MKSLSNGCVKGIILSILLSIVSLALPGKASAQLPSCGANVPYHYVDLTGNPAGSWISPSHIRNGNCCGTVSPDRCTSFEILLDPLAVGLSFEIVSGAVPTGSMFYQINCGPVVSVGEMICLTGPGPHRLTFCKPGNNPNQYRIKSISAPTFPADSYTRAGCSITTSALGFEPNTITWNTIAPGSFGQHNNLLSCTAGCETVSFSPQSSTIPYYDLYVCGFPIADECGFTQTLCDTVRVFVAPALQLSTSPASPKFCASGQGSGIQVQATSSGGGTNHTYTWINQSGTVVSNSSSYFSTQVENLVVQLDDQFSSSTCPSVQYNVAVQAVLPPSATITAADSVCASNPSIALMATASNASSYNWSGGSGSYIPNQSSLVASYMPSSSEISQGSLWHYFTVSSTDNVCPSYTDSLETIIIDSINVALSFPTVNCYDDSVWLVSSVGGGTGNYAFQWDGNPSSIDSIYVGAGAYCLNVSDQFGCVATECATISEPLPLSATSSSTNVTTVGGSDGTATVSPFGGTTPYTYSWLSTGGTNATDIGLPQGVYSCVVTDANGCSTTIQVAIVEPSCTGFEVSGVVKNPSCHDFSDGYVAAIPNNGTAPFTYLWDDPQSQTGDTAFALPAGTYTVIVQDVSGCLATTSVLVEEPVVLTLSLQGTDVSTVGGSDGQIQSIVSGGTQPYSYVWSHGDSLATAAGLTQGMYSVTVVDSLGCTISDSLLINDPDCSGFFAQSVISNLNCFGDGSGSISMDVAGGFSPYTYLWDGVVGNSTHNGLQSGTYSLVILDQAFCSIVDTFELTEPDELLVQGSVVHVSCYDSLNGSVDLTISGGTQPYLYNWNNGANTEDLISVPAGTYIINVQDSQNCSVLHAETVERPDSISITTSTTDNECFDDMAGAIDLQVSGGTSPYTYLWSNGQTTEDLLGLSGGLYWVSITDSKGCSDPVNIILIEEPDSLQLELTPYVYPSGYNISVPGGTNGWISSAAFGGTQPYQYAWSNGASDSVISNLSAGWYELILTDTNSCVVRAQVELTQPSALGFPSVVTDNLDGANDNFVILGLDLYPINELIIFNRWGNIVFEVENYKNDWHGQNASNEQLPEGYYYYIFKAPQIDDINGFVEIKR